MTISTKVTLSETAIVGMACNLPGSQSLDGFWDTLLAAKNVISPRPQGRWNVERFLRAGKPSPGFSYSFAGGYIDEPFAFDPAPFGISRREAEQMDPQQRLLLETTWKALEDAGVPPSSLAGQNVGVYVGASLVDYQSGGSYDPAVIGSHFMTGNALSVLSNRISYVFDLKGPSFTLDSACSSSFVALAQAMSALDQGEIDMAIVGGVNLLLSPAPFIGFSQARMLSPSGLCRPFSNDADGYVRSEGAIVLVLQRQSDALASGRRIHSVAIAAAINSDGRTNGISLPSQQGQQRLIENLYAAAGVQPDQLAFVEAHGTGTKVGDPIEAAAIGDSLGRPRSAPLPIGSVKSNIGHLEAASGLAGLLKASLAIERGVVPRSLFAETPNQSIDFGGLNIAPILSAMPIDGAGGDVLAGVCNYGFGGTNAHLILRSAPTAPARGASPVNDFTIAPQVGRQAEILLVSAATAEALTFRSRQIGDVLMQGMAAEDMAGALAYQHDILPFRLAIPLPPVGGDPGETVATLQAFSNGGLDASRATSAVASTTGRKPIFVFSGNGSQYPQMGETAYHTSGAFRREIEEIDALYRPIAGWSIAEQFRNGLSPEVLDNTFRTQPLIFAVQSAVSSILKGYGFHPAAVIGHSVGEVGAAECCGFVSRADALRIVHLRSEHQEGVRGKGRMLVLAAHPDVVEDLINRAQASAVDIAAYNSLSSITISGPASEITAIASLARKERVASVALKVEYPFHSRALDFLETKIVDDLAGIGVGSPHTEFYSTVTGRRLAERELSARYWWENIRRPVRFQPAFEEALEAHPNAAIIEIAPRAILQGPISDILRARKATNPIVATLSATDRADHDPFRTIAARCVGNGLDYDRVALFGDAPGTVHEMPSYPFRREKLHLGSTSEALNAYGRMIESVPIHPLLGSRASDGSPEWRNLLDPVLVPYLGDHQVDGAVVLPAAALIDMALAAGTELLGAVPLELDEFDILKAMTFQDDDTREVSTRFFSHTNVVEIWSRRRLAGNEWLLHARGALRRLDLAAIPYVELPEPLDPILSAANEIYAEADRAGLNYGPFFQVASSSRRDAIVIDSVMKRPVGGLGAFTDLHVVHPVSLDGAFHSLFIARPQREGERKAFLPIRFRGIRVRRPHMLVARAITELQDESDRFKSVSVVLLADDGEIIATIEAAVFRAVHLIKPYMSDRTFREEAVAIDRVELPVSLPRQGAAPLAPSSEMDQIHSLLKAFAISLARSLALELLPATSDKTFEVIVADGTVPAAAQSLLWRARTILALSGALETVGDGSRPSAVFAIPSPNVILGTLVQRFPRANGEIRLAAQAMAEAGEFLRTGVAPARRPSVPSDQWGLSYLSVSVAEAVADTVGALVAASPRKLRIVVAGDWNHGLASALQPAVQNGTASVTLVVRDQATADAQRHLPGAGTLFEVLVLDNAAVGLGDFDALIGFSLPGSPADLASPGFLSLVVPLLVQNAPILLGEPREDAHLAFLMSASTPASEATTSGAAGYGHDAILQQLELAGVVDTTIHDSPGSGVWLIGGRAAELSGKAEVTSVHVAIIAPPASNSTAATYGLLSGTVLARDDNAALDAWLDGLSGDVAPTIVFAPCPPTSAESENLSRHLDALTRVITTLLRCGRRCRLFVLTEGARSGASEYGPANAAVLSFSRVAINECAELDLRLIDIADPAAATRVGKILDARNDEREWRVASTGTAVTRVNRDMISDEALEADERSVLHFADGVGLDGFEWLKQPRRAPQEGQIEVEVAAAGLNYRDVLVGLGILDDDLLGAGLTKAALGFECSGRVVRLGPGVTQHRVGDAVMGFSAGAFSSHVVAPASHFFQVPPTIDLDAAATIPVAFATAWYALVEQGHVGPGSDVLVHGAAGGVGLAAIQIAKLKKARVLGTASSETRRAIALAAGADLAFDSRHERFAIDIKEKLDGVDIVLNSLAGEAMLASFNLLRPFGRFLELGKRDFLNNTQLALRPFLRNIAYFGIDLDELLVAKPDMARNLMTTIADLFAHKELHPLTYRLFESFEVGAAFRTMQASEHVGKIVIRPPRTARVDIASVDYRARAGLYIVVGGTTGLGFATAQWLSRIGASHIALLSRRGQIDEALAPLVTEMEQRGTTVSIESLDVCDADAVHAAIDDLCKRFGPLRGIVHAAVHLDDGLIANLTPTRLRAVLRTKIDGIVNLDAATSSYSLDFFVAYSSAATMVGSPGQAAYVAANAFLEGFMRRRRHLGKPALAIGWGAIADVGIIARDKQLGQRLRRTTGVVAMQSSEVLAHLGRLLGLGTAIDPVQVLTNIAPSTKADKLALLKSPAFVGLGFIKHEGNSGPSDEEALDLRGKSVNEAVEIVTAILCREVGEILRIPAAMIDLSRPLVEIGLDSLMALELHLALETALGVQIAVVGAGDRNLAAMARMIVDQIDQGGSQSSLETDQAVPATLVNLASIHSAGTLSPDETNRLDQAVRGSLRGVA